MHNRGNEFNYPPPPIGTNDSYAKKQTQHFQSKKSTPTKRQILNQQPPRNLPSLKQKSSTSTYEPLIIKPIGTKTKQRKNKTSSNDNEAEIKECISNVDEIFKDIADYLQTPEFKEAFGSIPIPPNLITNE